MYPMDMTYAFQTTTMNCILGFYKRIKRMRKWTILWRSLINMMKWTSGHIFDWDDQQWTYWLVCILVCIVVWSKFLNILVDIYESSGIGAPNNHGGRSRIGAKKEFLLFLWYVGNTVTFRQLGNLFGICKSSAWHAVQKVSSWLVKNSSNYIKWPTGQEATAKIASF